MAFHKTTRPPIDQPNFSSDAAHSMAQIEEEVSTTISWRVYVDYLRACGSLFHVVYMTGLLIIGQGGSTMTILWLSWWIRNSFGLSLGLYVGVYAALCVVQAILIYTFSVTMTWLATSGNKRLFDNAAPANSACSGCFLRYHASRSHHQPLLHRGGPNG